MDKPSPSFGRNSAEIFSYVFRIVRKCISTLNYFNSLLPPLTLLDVHPPGNYLNDTNVSVKCYLQYT